MTSASSPLSSAPSSRLGRAIKPVQHYGGFTNSDDIESEDSDSDTRNQTKTEYGKDEDSEDDDFDIGTVAEKEEDEEAKNEDTESETEKTKSKSRRKTTKEVKSKAAEKGKTVKKQSKALLPALEIKRGKIAKTLTLPKSAHKAVPKLPIPSDEEDAFNRVEIGDTTNEDKLEEKTNQDEDDKDGDPDLVPPPAPKLNSTPKVKVIPKKPLLPPKGTAAASSQSATSTPRKKGFTPLKTIPLSSPASRLFPPLKKTSALLSSSSSFTELKPKSPAVNSTAKTTSKSLARKATGTQQVKDGEAEESGGGEGGENGEVVDNGEEGDESSLAAVQKASGKITKPHKAVLHAPPENSPNGNIDDDDNEMQVGEGGKTKEEDCVEEQSSQTPGATPKSTPKKRKAPSSLVDDSSPSKKKPAPAEKVTSSQRVVILEGLNQPAVYKSVDMNKLATSFGGDVTAPKLVRHWREVLFFDLKAFFSGEAAKKSLGKASMGPEVRKGLWQAMVQACDKVDWKVVEERTGLSASKLKRHLRESMRKEGERFIAH